MSRKRFTADQWGVWFKEFDQSGLTVAKFCQLKGTTANTFYSWRRRLREQSGGLPAKQIDDPRFVAVQLTQSLVEFEFVEGVIARLPNDRDSLRPMIDVLLERGAKR